MLPGDYARKTFGLVFCYLPHNATLEGTQKRSCRNLSSNTSQVQCLFQTCDFDSFLGKFQGWDGVYFIHHSVLGTQSQTGTSYVLNTCLLHTGTYTHSTLSVFFIANRRSRNKYMTARIYLLLKYLHFPLIYNPHSPPEQCFLKDPYGNYVKENRRETQSVSKFLLGLLVHLLFVG